MPTDPSQVLKMNLMAPELAGQAAHVTGDKPAQGLAGTCNRRASRGILIPQARQLQYQARVWDLRMPDEPLDSLDLRIQAPFLFLQDADVVVKRLRLKAWIEVLRVRGVGKHGSCPEDTQEAEIHAEDALAKVQVFGHEPVRDAHDDVIPRVDDLVLGIIVRVVIEGRLADVDDVYAVQNDTIWYLPFECYLASFMLVSRDYRLRDCLFGMVWYPVVLACRAFGLRAIVELVRRVWRVWAVCVLDAYLFDVVERVPFLELVMYDELDVLGL